MNINQTIMVSASLLIVFAASSEMRRSGQEATDRHMLGDEPGRNEAQKGGTQQTCLIESNGVAPSRGDHYGRRKTLRTKGQEESREHQPWKA